MRVSRQAVIRRINRKLSKQEERLLTARLVHVPGRGYEEDVDLGRYYIIDLHHNLVAAHVNLEMLAREEGCLAEGERVTGI
jgi:hypothetical protein